MSRGPGRWQRLLLDRLQHGDVLVVDVVVYNELEREPTRAEMVAARRAAGRLAADGKTRAIYLGRCRSCGELSLKWDCRACGKGCGQVLALTSTTGFWSTVPTLMTAGTNVPDWLSVASGRNAAEATLTPLAGVA